MAFLRALSLTTSAAPLAIAILAAPATARADEDVSTYTPRIGVHPLVMGGAAVLTNPSPFPGFIGLTGLGGEIHGEIPPWGLFGRFLFQSSGDAGHWTAPSVTLGASYRIFGDGVEHISLLARAGGVWEHWHGTDSPACPIDLFVPTNCKALETPPLTGEILNQPTYNTLSNDLFGLMAGLRTEMPLSQFFVAFDGEFAGLVDVSGTTPGAVFEARAMLLLGFRDSRAAAEQRKDRDQRRIRPPAIDY